VLGSTLKELYYSTVNIPQEQSDSKDIFYKAIRLMNFAYHM